MAAKGKSRASIDDCGQCKSLHETITDALKIAEKQLEDGDISGAIAAIENAHQFALLFLTEDHGPDCGYKSLKNGASK